MHRVFRALLPFLAIITLTVFCLQTDAGAVSMQSEVETTVKVEFTSFGDLSAEIGFSIDDIVVEPITVEGLNYNTWFISGESGTPGGDNPGLPRVVRMVLMPPQSGVEVRLIDREFRTERNANLLPAVAELYNDQRIELKDGEVDFHASVVPGDGFYPPEIVELGRPAIMRGYRILPVIIHPVRWNPATDELEITGSIDIELDFTSNRNRVNVVKNPQRPRPSKNVFNMVSDMVINPPTPPRDIEHASGSVLYVTGNWNNIVAELEPLVEWRRKMGWKAEILRVNNNTNNNAIRNEIIELYEEGEYPPEYVIICGDAAEQYTMACWIHYQPGNPYETDHNYAMLDGDDVLADVGLGRFVFDSPQMLRDQVEKTIQYESEPYIGVDDEIGWQKRAAVASTDWRNGLPANNLCRWSREMFLDHGFDEANELLCSSINTQPNPTGFINSNFNGGISFYIHRGWERLNGYEHAQVQSDLRNARMLPLVILATCNTGDFFEHAYNFWSYIERFMWHENGGAIGAVGTGGATHTYYNNCLVAGMLYGIFVEDIHQQGWALMRGKLDLYRSYYDRNDINHHRTGVENWLTHTFIFNLMGDPAVDNFTDVPQLLAVEHPDSLRSGESRVAVNVMYEREEDNEPAGDVPVCLYKPGVFQELAWTDNEGNVVFSLDPEWMDEGSVFLTITGHNLMTYTAELEIEDPEAFIGCGACAIDDDDEGESSGDGDGIANPTERLELQVEIVNYGEEVPDGEVTARMTTLNPELEVIEGEVRFESAPEPDEPVTAAFVVEIGGGFQHGKTAAFDVALSIGDVEWKSSIALEVEGASLEFDGFEWEGDPLTPGNLASMLITLRNNGSKASPQLTARMTSLVGTVDVPEAEVFIEPIDPGESGQAEEYFTLSAHPLHLGGRSAELVIALEAENGFVDTVSFSLVVGDAMDGQPFGPDDYGYVCFDDTDTTWFAVPVFEWIEIDPNEEGEGDSTGLSDSGTSHDTSMVMPLPFMFTYYGEEFNEVTICTNGWMAFGDHSSIVTSCNRPIPGGLLTPAMLCPFWDDLKTTNGGGVYTWYSEEDHIFVVEWSRMPRNCPGPPAETFEVILYDPEFHPTLSGDGDIVFQYLDIEDHRGAADAWGETPYATVGLVSPDMSTGLQYSYWNELSPGAAPIEDGRAIKFTTLLEFETAYIYGWVTDAASGDSLESVLVTTDFGFWGLTDEHGFYEMVDVLVDTSSIYTFRARKQFYNDSTVTGIELDADDTLEVSFNILHPEFFTEIENFEAVLEPKHGFEINVPLINNGNGTLEFSSSIEFARPNVPERDDLWDDFMTIPVSNYQFINEGDTTTLGNRRIFGVTFMDSLFYISGSGNERAEVPAKIYIFDRDGVFVDSTALPWIDNWGVRGLTNDGVNVWGGYRNCLYKFDHDFTVLDSFEVPVSYATDVAYDRATATLFTCYPTRPIIAVDTLGNVIAEYESEWQGSALRVYSVAWFPQQPDSLKLYFTAVVDDISMLFGMNTATGEIQLLHEFVEIESDRVRGIDISDRWNSSVWTLCAVIDNNTVGDRVTVYELEPNTTWLSYSPSYGTLAAGCDTMLHIRVESALRPFDHYWVTLRYEYTAAPGCWEIPISMWIVEESGLDAGETVPQEFSLGANFPNPFNARTNIAYSLDKAGDATLSLFDINGRLIEVLKAERQAAGAHHVTFKADKLPNGVYLYRLQSGSNTAVRKMVVLK